MKKPLRCEKPYSNRLFHGSNLQGLLLQGKEKPRILLTNQKGSISYIHPLVMSSIQGKKYHESMNQVQLVQSYQGERQW